jgi:hypothetical protein
MSFSGESSAAEPCICGIRERLKRTVEQATAEHERSARLLHDCIGTAMEADSERLFRETDEARLKLHAARLAMDRHIVEHGCARLHAPRSRARFPS